MAPAQVEQEGVLDHLDLDAGVGAGEVGQRRGQQVLHDDEGGGHAQQAGQLASRPATWRSISSAWSAMRRACSSTSAPASVGR